MGRSGRGRVVKESRAEEEGAQDALREAQSSFLGEDSDIWAGA